MGQDEEPGEIPRYGGKGHSMKAGLDEKIRIPYSAKRAGVSADQDIFAKRAETLLRTPT